VSSTFDIQPTTVPPTITPFGFEEDLVSGDQVTLQCSARGDLPMTLSWIYHLKSNLSISQDGIRTSKLSPRTSVLIIDSLGSEHLGDYTCIARSGTFNLAGNYTAVLRSVNGILRFSIQVNYSLHILLKFAVA